MGGGGGGGRDSQCVRVLIPDVDVGHRSFHDVVLVDRTKEDASYVVVSDLSALRQQWLDVVISGMMNRQLELEELRRMWMWSPDGVMYILWKSYQAGYISICGKLSFGTLPALAMPSVMVCPMEGYTTGLY